MILERKISANMPKKGRKSIGQSTSKVRKYRSANEETTFPCESQESISNIEEVEVSDLTTDATK